MKVRTNPLRLVTGETEAFLVGKGVLLLLSGEKRERKKSRAVDKQKSKVVLNCYLILLFSGILLHL